MKQIQIHQKQIVQLESNSVPKARREVPFGSREMKEKKNEKRTNLGGSWSERSDREGSERDQRRTPWGEWPELHGHPQEAREAARTPTTSISPPTESSPRSCTMTLSPPHPSIPIHSISLSINRTPRNWFSQKAKAILDVDMVDLQKRMLRILRL